MNEILHIHVSCSPCNAWRPSATVTAWSPLRLTGRCPVPVRELYELMQLLLEEDHRRRSQTAADRSGASDAS